METKVNKAQEKRNRENFQFINSDIRRRLAEFENDYLNKAVQYEIESRQIAIKNIEKEISDLKEIKEPTVERYSTAFKKNRTVYVRDLIRDLEYKKDGIQKQLKFDATIKMNTFNSSKKSYDEKVNRLVETLVSENFGYSRYNVEELRDRSSRFEFLISNNEKECHARLIWVDAVEVAPHFRFITTTRKK